jgi:mannose-6-phosphate isomerase-like protein (cupin superfamily)
MKFAMTALLLAGFAAPWGRPADGPSFAQWKASDLKGIATALTPKLKNGSASEPMANMGNYTFARIMRTASGTVEVHETMADIFVIESGEATLVVGGTVVGGKETQPHEIRGASITGGTESKLGPGDVLTIPAKMPHQMKVAAGKQVTYLAIKVAQ